MAEIKAVDFRDELSKRYLSYALSTIMSRSLPDVRDGLKPVHRRLVFAMLQLKLDPKAGFKKCARIVGDVMGKYHPHGDTAIYDSLVRMAQTFASRMPIIEGQGNLGSVDGDAQAAMRYTEARLTEYALSLLKDIDKDTVDFDANYDGTEKEPIVLPARLPNILINGTEGIAVGMATSIPPHNILELCDALIYLIKKPKCEIMDLFRYVKGPDFPTRGILLNDPEALHNIYTTGKGGLRLRAKWERVELPRSRYYIKVFELPYQVQKRKLIERLEDLHEAKKLPLLESFQDLSGENIEIQLYPKSRNVNPNLLMETLFKLTDLETRIQFNMNVLDHGVIPRVMNLKGIMSSFLQHKKEVLVNKTKYRLSEIDGRLEILSGLLVTFLNLDKVIHVIRTDDEPGSTLMQLFELTDKQADSILNTRLKSLRKLEELQLQKEKEELEREKEQLLEMLGADTKVWNTVTRDIKKLKTYYSKLKIAQRKTIIEEAPVVGDVIEEEFIEKAAITIAITKQGWIKAVKGHQHDVSTSMIREGDALEQTIRAYSTDKLIIYSNFGKFYTLSCDDISKGRGAGDPLRVIFDMAPQEQILYIGQFMPGYEFLLVSQDGKGFRVNSNEVLAHTKNGKQVMTCKEAEATHICVVEGDTVLMLGTNHRLLLFPVEQVPLMKRGKGVRLQHYKEGRVADVMVIIKKQSVEWTDGKGKLRKLEKIPFWYGKRGERGKLALQKLWIDN